MTSGYLYILQNKSFGSFVVKIGFTTLNPDVRAKQIFSGATGVPEPFDIAYACRVVDCERAEQLIHKRLSAYRIHQRREFFQMSPTVAQQVIYAVSTELNRELGVDDAPMVHINNTVEENPKTSSDEEEKEDQSHFIEIDPSLVNRSPLGTSALSKDQYNRIEIVKAILDEFCPESKETWQESFTRDSNPEIEIRVWEHIAKAFLKIDQISLFSQEQRKEVYYLLLWRSGRSTDFILRHYDGTVFAKTTVKAILSAYELPPIPLRVTFQPSKKPPKKIILNPKILNSAMSQIYSSSK